MVIICSLLSGFVGCTSIVSIFSFIHGFASEYVSATSAGLSISGLVTSILSNFQIHQNQTTGDIELSFSVRTFYLAVVLPMAVISLIIAILIHLDIIKRDQLPAAGSLLSDEDSDSVHSPNSTDNPNHEPSLDSKMSNHLDGKFDFEDIPTKPVSLETGSSWGTLCRRSRELDVPASIQSIDPTTGDVSSVPGQDSDGRATNSSLKDSSSNEELDETSEKQSFEFLLCCAPKRRPAGDEEEIILLASSPSSSSPAEIIPSEDESSKRRTYVAWIPIVNQTWTAFLAYWLMPSFLPYFSQGFADGAEVSSLCNTIYQAAGIVGRLMPSFPVRIYASWILNILQTAVTIVLCSLSFFTTTTDNPMSEGLVLVLIGGQGALNGYIATVNYLLLEYLTIKKGIRPFSDGEKKVVKRMTGLMNQLGCCTASVIVFFIIQYGM
ncbi:hypothetical protein ADUPG1_006107 [Aduncisulcus paluster]|uniref:Uncharacterized protein n=1 Tax=Aduncisulcus paluster TaxID=2918883 RepID=A0ABQ5KGW6_9EUKA|nr:hypothetical protein ADUPG1_006107 [Aduncisulcus paluster]